MVGNQIQDQEHVTLTILPDKYFYYPTTHKLRVLILSAANEYFFVKKQEKHLAKCLIQCYGSEVYILHRCDIIKN